MNTHGLLPSENRLNVYFPCFHSLEKIDWKIIFLCDAQEQRHME